VRLSLSRLEELTAVPYILFVGMTWGVLVILPSFAAPTGRPGFVTALLVGAATGGGAVLLWWASVRRRRFSVWASALHATLALALADAVAMALGLSFAHAPGEIPATVRVLSRHNLMLTFEVILALSPVRFVAAAVLLAFGRLLPGSGRLIAVPAVAGTRREPVS